MVTRKGLVAPHVKTAESGELAGPITDAVLEDLRDNYVFQGIDTFAEEPDVILTGRITKFYETYGPKAWSRLPYAKVLAKLIEADTYTATAEVDLEIILLGPQWCSHWHMPGSCRKDRRLCPEQAK